MSDCKCNGNEDEILDCGCDHEDGDCDCGHDHDTIWITLDDDTEVECNVLGVFEVKDNEYIALLPKEDDTVLLYGFKEDDEGIELIAIESDEDFEAVSEAFNQLFGDEEGFEEE